MNVLTNTSVRRSNGGEVQLGFGFPHSLALQEEAWLQQLLTTNCHPPTVPLLYWRRGPAWLRFSSFLGATRRSMASATLNHQLSSRDVVAAAVDCGRQ